MDKKPTTSNYVRDDSIPKVCLRLPYTGKYGETIVKTTILKLKRLISAPCEFVVFYNTVKTSYFLNVKDPIPHELKSMIVYQFTCPGCNDQYIGKTICLSPYCKEYMSTALMKLVKFTTICIIVNPFSIYVIY